MDSTLSLAVMMKAKIVFERGSDFLCFPLTPISYVPSDLSFLFDAAPSAVDLTNLSAFSTLVNMIPDDLMWPPSQARMLWDAYADVLHNADLAQSTRTADEQQQYDAANAVLYTANADGTRTGSPMLQAYDQYRDAYIVAEQNYATAKNTAETSTDPAVKNQWATQGPVLQQAVDDANNAWSEKGYKSQIEDAQGVAARLGAKSPEIEWQQWTAQFDPNINALTDAAGQSFYPSAPSPANVFEEGAVWQQFTLLGDEADDLVKLAPADLRSRLAPQSLDVAVQKVSFEFTSVVLKRAWFDAQIFDRRFWRFRDGHSVSDGQSLANGNCPAYVVAVVLARNVQVELATDPVRNAPLMSYFAAGKQLDLGFLALQPAPQPAPAAGTMHAMHVVADAPITLAVSSHPVTAVALAERISTNSAAAIRPAMRPMLARVGTSGSAELVSRPVAFNRAFATIADARRTRRWMPPIEVPPTTGNSSPPPSVPPPSTAPDVSTMFVLGFLCRHVPPTPNPDPTLTWSQSH